MRRLLTVLLLACAPVLGVAMPAQAHNVLVGSDPKDGAQVATAPDRITLDFDQPVRRDFARIAVTGPDGATYERGEVTAKADSVSIGLAPLGPAGAYVIGYRIVSNDGHPVTGTITFTLTTAGQAAGQPSPSTTPSTTPSTASSTAPVESPSANPPESPSATPSEQAQTGGRTLPPAAGGQPDLTTSTTDLTAQSSSGGWVWGLLVGTLALLALSAYVLVRHDRRARSAA
ncbi:copper resistance protein CopC [Microtetraspora sp. AC03309]|uniref:copper resistance CopC family protein n=1 Tax=Microtetraspora sp. AC03309 TaxID=2779376 RepID=UPI001E52BFA6|nr:copper resistance CopC family protein [Microtetraspora sp. AC03309]MCC5578842.1 copper resistance protein CopC [Microtetraspora sp. AC03309]